MKLWGKILGIGMMITTTAAMAAELTLAPLFSDQMVLQREQPVAIWGQATPGVVVNIQLQDHADETIPNAQGKAIADNSGRWQATLPALPAGGPFTLITSTDQQQLTVKDIWLGDVWLASGQSNMEWPLSAHTENWQQEAKDAAYPKIRFFNVPNRIAATPQTELSAASWVVASSETVPDFSAIGWYFAKQNHLEKGVAVGIIDATWGGTVAEAWTPAQALLQVPAYQKAASEVIANSAALADDIRRNTQNEQQKRLLIQSTAGSEQLRLADVATDDSQWSVVNLPARTGLTDVVWLRKELTLNAVPKQASLYFGTLHEMGRIFVNGQLVAEKRSWSEPHQEILLPAGLLKQGKNVVALRLINAWDNQVVAGEAGKMWLKTDAIRHDLAGSWRFNNQAEPAMPSVRMQNWLPGTLFNAMIKPIVPYGIKGVLWYQGESNADKAADYHQLFATMIQSWRAEWQQELPFLFVQLASFMQPKAQPAPSQWASLREAQFQTLKLPATAMVVTTDLGDANDIHPARKKPVAERLWLAARQQVFGEAILASGPVFSSMQNDGKQLRLRFDHIGNGLHSKEGDLRGFAIAGSDGKYVNASAKLEGNEVLVWSDKVAKPVSVRFGWADFTDANLYNSVNLPAVPFRAGEGK
ncbi:MAG: sialate O-acetylesterase [Gammaproteobacteria bacterium]|nr:sialate O-acetylesterase [Gammaproteobacteria bacterium]